MSTSGGDSADGGDATGEPGTSDRIAGNPRTGRYTTSAARDFLAETLDPDAAQNRQSLRRISAKKLIVALTVFFAGLASTYLSTHILADDAAEVADKAADKLDESKPAVDAHLSYIPAGDMRAAEDDYWEFDRYLTQNEVDAINGSLSSDAELRRQLTDLGGRRVLGRRGAPQNAPLPYLSLRLELSSQRAGLITIQRIYAKTIECGESTARAALVPAPTGGVSNRDGLIFDFTRARNPGDTVEAADDATGEPYLRVKAVSLRGDLEPAFLNISVASERGCKWSLP